MGALVNTMAALLLALSITYYVFIYTVWLKRRSVGNVVVGGVSGALPPVIGWAAVTGDVSLASMTLFAIIFLWTPPHSWALALFCQDDFKKARIPMLPVVTGPRRAAVHILAYSVLLVPVSFLPVVLGMNGPAYGIVAGLLGVGFLRHALNVWRDPAARAARALFRFSILYMFLIFVALMIDGVL